jgi:hypothetical protein
MKQVSLLLVALFSAAVVFGQAKSLEFKETSHSFGKIKQHTPVTYVFSFKNVAEKPMVIESATAECGCTTPVYPKGVIAKGAANTLKVTYNAEAMGAFTKRVTVKLANVETPIVLTIDGEVVDAKATAKGKTGK